MASNSNSIPDTETLSNQDCSAYPLLDQQSSSNPDLICGPISNCRISSEAEAYGVCPLLLQNLTEMGVSLNLAVRALQHSGNATVSAAFDWLGNISSEDQETLSLKPVSHDEAEWEDVAEAVPDQRPKMALIVNAELGMKPGKMAAQVGHCVLGLHRLISRKGGIKHKQSVRLWECEGERMVVLRAADIRALRCLQGEADMASLSSYQVEDAGLTQIAAGSRTVLGIFGVAEDVDKITGNLKLY